MYRGARQVIDWFYCIPIRVIAVLTDVEPEFTGFISLEADKSLNDAFLYLPFRPFVGSRLHGAIPLRCFIVILSRGRQ